MKTLKQNLGRALLAGAVCSAWGWVAMPALAEGAAATAASASAAHPGAAHKKAGQKADQKAVLEVLGSTSPSATQKAFAASDRDNDGVISLDEFHKDILKSWRALDLDHNGEITKAELESIPDRGAVRAMLRLLQRSDSNGDLKLSFKELVEARMAFFDEADANHDDRLSLSEVLEFESKHRAMFKESLAEHKREAAKAAAAKK